MHAAIATPAARQLPRDEDALLRWIVSATAALTGDDFFHTLMRNLAEAFGLRCAFIAECVDRPVTRVRTLAYWFDDEMRSNFEFDIAGTPCELTLREGGVVCIGEGLGARYPSARQRRLDGYLGAPIFDTAGRQLIGHVAFETEGPLDRGILDSPLFQIFVSRASAELRRKRAEDVLRASEENYRLLLEHQTDVVVKYDSEQRLLFASPSFCRLFGTDEAGLLGRVFRREADPQDRQAFSAAWDVLAAPPHEVRFEERLRTAQGWRCIAWSQKAMLDAQGRLAAVVADGRDVTERRRAEEQGRQHLQQLAHVGRISAMGEMASAIAHEIIQPLTAVRTYAQACQRLLAAGESPAALAQTLERVAVQAERAAQIIHRLRGFMAREDVRAVPVDANVLATEVLDLCRAEASQCGVQLQLRLQPALPAMRVDKIQIEQVVLNLARNGIESMHQSQCEQRLLAVETRAVETQSHQESHPGEVWITVRDTGPGVPTEAAPRIFDAFFTTKPGGMGVGLAISRSIAEAHGGRLWLDQPPGCTGACFHLALPLAANP